ncbi:MAG: hypothetical protein MZW92_77680 [Comamonadaceae bacterium]|nr:hypothetical protein [Comamonadaceae bacterium]
MTTGAAADRRRRPDAGAARRWLASARSAPPPRRRSAGMQPVPRRQRADAEPRCATRAAQVHQASGALQLLDLRGVALLTEADRAAAAALGAEPKRMPAGRRARRSRRALSAVVAYLEGLLAGRPNQPIRLFPYYRDVLQLAGARARPSGRPGVPRPVAAAGASTRSRSRPLTADQLRVRRVALRGRPARLPARRRRRRGARAACATRSPDLERLPQRGLARSFWWVVRGLLEALDADALAGRRRPEARAGAR